MKKIIPLLSIIDEAIHAPGGVSVSRKETDKVLCEFEKVSTALEACLQGRMPTAEHRCSLTSVDTVERRVNRQHKPVRVSCAAMERGSL